MLSVFKNTTDIKNIRQNLNIMLNICFELSNDSISQFKRNILVNQFKVHLNNIIEENNIFQDFTYDLNNATNSIETYRKIMNIKVSVL